MKLTLLIAATALALSAPAVPHAHAACATFNGTSAVVHWQQREIDAKADRDQRPMLPTTRPIIELHARAMYARLIANSALCEQNAISFYDYEARMLEDINRGGQ